MTHDTQTREALIEVMARAILQDFEDGADMSTHPVPERAASRNARAALAAIEAAGVRLVDAGEVEENARLRAALQAIVDNAEIGEREADAAFARAALSKTGAA
jgi:hypothetical protein